MSKVDELRKKYPNVTTVTFNKFVNGDKTNTKKYLPFMLKTWVNRNGYINTSADLVKLVNMFDELLPYIENKDIYSKNYENIKYFVEAMPLPYLLQGGVHSPQILGLPWQDSPVRQGSYPSLVLHSADRGCPQP